MEYVADAFLDESVKDNPSMQPQYIQNQILQRRYEIQYRLDNANINEGCYSKASLAAKTHYQEFSRYSLSDIRAFIDQNSVQ
ncbi:MAG: hypothetical protein GW778_02775 [Alphaproteobacteria bacterium]|nr:hypothetical protein [Alphaproteobacteria bacterium]